MRRGAPASAGRLKSRSSARRWSSGKPRELGAAHVFAADRSAVAPPALFGRFLSLIRKLREQAPAHEEIEVEDGVVRIVRCSASCQIEQRRLKVADLSIVFWLDSAGGCERLALRSARREIEIASELAPEAREALMEWLSSALRQEPLEERRVEKAAPRRARFAFFASRSASAKESHT
jgi:hypothetical protein